MKYYSEVLNKNFDTIEDLESAEEAEKKKALTKAKEDAARKAEIDAAKKACNAAKADYEAALRVCREALSRWSAAERELVTVESRNRAASGCAQTYDNFKKLAERWDLGDWFFI